MSKNNKKLKEGITHVEDLAIEDFIQTIRNIADFEASEKLDGAQLAFGIDEDRKFFTSREGKSGQRYYNEQDYGSAFWTTGFRGAHLALEKKAPIIKQILSPNDLIEVEVLYGPQPNAIPYKQDINHIVFLRNLQGNTDLEKLRDILGDTKTKIVLDNVPETNDGKNITTRDEVQIWQFESVPKVDSSEIETLQYDSNIEQKLKELEKYLKAKSGVYNFNNLEVLSIKLNKRPDNIDQNDWKEAKEILKEKRDQIIEHILGIKLHIKNELLNSLVRKISSALGPDVEDGGWIEGIVFRHKDTGDQFKLVDKDIFTAINKFNFEIREKIKTQVFVPLKKDIAELIGHPQLATTMKNRYLKGFENPSEELGKDLNINNIKSKANTLINNALKKLNSELADYKQQRPQMVQRFKVGSFDKTMDYEGEIHTRTMQDFASTFNKIKELKSRIDQAASGPEFVHAFITENIMSEGGNVFDQTGRINKEDIEATIDYIANNSPITKQEIKDNLLGSVGKAATSGDIDIAVDGQKYDKEKFKAALISKVGANNVGESKGFNIIHLKTPIAGDESKGFVQVDFMFSENPEWAKFNFFSAGDASKYKGAYRTRLLAAIAASFNQVEHDQDGELIKRSGWVWVPNKGLEKQIRYRPIKKDGTRAKGWKVESQGQIISEPNKVAKQLFGSSASVKDLESVETIINLMKKKFNSEQYNKIIEIYKQGLQNSGLEIPNELK